MKIVRTKTEDGLRLAGFLSEPEEKTGKIIVHIHGIAGTPYRNPWYPHFHDAYPKNGYAFLAGEHRGTGSVTAFPKEPNEDRNYGNAFELFEESVFDIDAWITYARNTGYTDIILQAHSFAPSKVVYYVNQKPDAEIRALILISPVDMLGSTLANTNHETMYAEAIGRIANNTPRSLLSELLDGELLISAQTYANLFGNNSKANVFCYTDRKHDWSLVENVSLPVLLVGGTKDDPIERMISTKQAFETLKKRFVRSGKVEAKIYEGATHSFSRFENKIIEDALQFLSGTEK